MNSLFGSLGGLLTVGAVVIAFIFVLREILTWYWKLNKIVALLEQIEENTSKSHGESRHAEKVIGVQERLKTSGS